MDWSVGISIVSVLIAGITLFLTQLRPPQVSLYVGPSLKVYYTRGGGLSFYIPITFLNNSPRTGTVLRMSLTLFKKDASETRYLFQWRSFSKFDPGTNSWVFEEIAHAISIPGKATLAKTVWFSWPEEWEEKPILREGAYDVVIHRWVSENKPPIGENHELFISAKDLQTLETRRGQQNSTTIDLVFDRKLAEHKVLTKHEYDKLLSS